jgi:hypothetical protein
MGTPFRLEAPVAPEDDLHVAVAKMLTFGIGQPGITSPLGVMWYSFEMRNAKSAHEGARRKRCGCVAGLPDLHLLFMGRLFTIELKTLRKGSGLNDAQKIRHPELRKAGAEVAVARTLDEVMAAIRGWNIPLTHRMAI